MAFLIWMLDTLLQVEVRKLKILIFRQAEMTVGVVQTSYDKALRYYTYLHYL